MNGSKKQQRCRKRRDRPRRPHRLETRLRIAALRQTEERRQRRNTELYPARRVRMIALNAKWRTDRARDDDLETAQMAVELVLMTLDETLERLRENGILPPLIMRR